MCILHVALMLDCNKQTCKELPSIYALAGNRRPCIMYTTLHVVSVPGQFMFSQNILVFILCASAFDDLM